MPKVEEKYHILRLKRTAVIEKPMVLIPIDEYEELIENAESAKSRTLTKDIEESRKRFIKGKGRSLEAVVRGIESNKAR